MRDAATTKTQLIKELRTRRQRFTELAAAEEVKETSG